MSGKTLRLRIAALVVLALLAASGAEAGVRSGFPSHPEALAVTWNLVLERLWTLLTGKLPKNGCTIDPNGASCPHSQSLENGCSLDPNGVCAPVAPSADAGCSLDPSGRCSK